ncbi:MAG: RNA methyltransferase [Prevotella sp.]|nr:RNA methyltransferase [Prevotella sp.]
MSENIITSTQNPKVRLLLALQQKSSERRARDLFVVEGRREVSHCLEAGMAVEALFYCPTLLENNEEDFVVFDEVPVSRRFQVSPEVYAKIAYRGGTEGIMAEVRPRRLSLGDLSLGNAPLIIVLESVEKPGNLGAVLRSADAAHADAVIICDPLTDLYNPNLIRSSLGAVFTVPCVACTSGECIKFLEEKGVSILTAQLQDSHLYYDTDMTGATALVMGTESTGLSEQWRQAADAHIRIPMRGRLDSLNVSVSTAILLFEAVRQRLSIHG